MRAESIGSSWIEGLSISQRRVLHALYVPAGSGHKSGARCDRR
jgi:hypothetical protein